MQKLFSPLAACTLAAAAAFCAPAAAVTVVYTATLSGAAEAPSNASPGTGTATVTLDSVLGTMRVQTNFSGLLGNTTAAHIHCCTATPGTGTAGVVTPVPTFPGFPLGVTAGSYDATFDLAQSASFNPTFVTNQGGLANAQSVFLAGLAAGQAYLNIHTTTFGGGEIRGFLTLAPVPEPGTWALMLGGLALVGAAGRKRLKAD